MTRHFPDKRADILPTFPTLSDDPTSRHFPPLGGNVGRVGSVRVVSGRSGERSEARNLIDVEHNPHGELASAAIAIAFAMRVRGRPDDQTAAQLLDRLGTRALMRLAGELARGVSEEGSNEVATRSRSGPPEKGPDAGNAKPDLPLVTAFRHG
jgi:hypothetical protein